MSKEKYCLGCGVKLQDDNIKQEGYTSSLDNDICSRCFRMKNYGEYQVVAKSNEDFINILKSINKTKDLVLYIVDILNTYDDINYIRDYIDNKMILVLNKRDVLPKSVKDEKLIAYFKNLGLDFQDILIASANKNYNVDDLMAMIKKYKTSRNVYVVGHTNVGKSTMISKLIKNYSEYDSPLTISPLPSTTLDKITIKISDDLTIIDTPGLIDRGSIVNYIDQDALKKINPKKEIKPKTYQIKPNQALIIDDLVRIDYVEGERNSFTVYMSNNLKIKRVVASRHDELTNLTKTSIDMNYHEDLVIDGLGFIKIVNKGKIDVYVPMNVKVFKRESLI